MEKPFLSINDKQNESIDDNNSDIGRFLEIIQFKSNDNSFNDDLDEIYPKDFLTSTNLNYNINKNLTIEYSEYKTGETDFCSKDKIQVSSDNKVNINSPSLQEKDSIHAKENIILDNDNKNNLHISNQEIKDYLEYYYINKKTLDNKKISKFIISYFQYIVKDAKLISILFQCIKVMKVVSIDNILSFFLSEIINFLKNKEANDIILMLYSFASEELKISIINNVFNNIEDVIKNQALEKSLIHLVEWADFETVQNAIIIKFSNINEDLMLNNTVLKLLEIIIGYENLDINFIKVFITTKLKDLIKLDYGYYLIKRYIKITSSESEQEEFLKNFICILREEDLFSLNGSLICQCIIRNFKLVEIHNLKDLEVAKSYDLEIINPYIKDKNFNTTKINPKPNNFKNECAEYFKAKRKERLDLLFKKNYWINHNSKPLLMFYNYLLNNFFYVNEKYISKKTFIQLLSCLMKFSTFPFYVKFLDKFVNEVSNLKKTVINNDTNFKEFYEKLSKTAIYITVSFNDETLITNFLNNLDYDSVSTFLKSLDTLIEYVSKALSYHESQYYFNNTRTYSILNDIKGAQKIFREISKYIIPDILKSKLNKRSIESQINSIYSYLSYKKSDDKVIEEKKPKKEKKKKEKKNAINSNLIPGMPFPNSLHYINPFYYQFPTNVNNYNQIPNMYWNNHMIPIYNDYSHLAQPNNMNFDPNMLENLKK